MPDYYAFTHGRYPSWWTDRFDAEFPDTFGAYENVPQSGAQALIVTPTHVHVLDADCVEVVRVEYASIEGFEHLTKDPIPETICVRLASGVTAELPVLGKTGAIFDWMRFLLNAVRCAR